MYACHLSWSKCKPGYWVGHLRSFRHKNDRHAYFSPLTQWHLCISQWGKKFSWNSFQLKNTFVFTRFLMNLHSHIAIVVRPPGRKTLCRSLVICKGFFRPATPAVIWQVFQFCKEIWFGLWSCYLRMAFLDGDNFCKAFAGAQVNLSYHKLHFYRGFKYQALSFSSRNTS